jgi:hypothetical protein
MGRGRVRALIEKTDSLFAETLKGGYDDTQPWNAIHALRKTGRRAVFERAAMWCSSPSPLKRARGADILAQLGRYNRSRRRYAPLNGHFAPKVLISSPKLSRANRTPSLSDRRFLLLVILIMLRLFRLLQLM